MTVLPIRPFPLPTPSVAVERGRLVYLPGPGLVVVPECRLVSGWRCGVIATHTSMAASWHVDLDHTELAQALPVPDPGPEAGVEVAAMWWTARVWQCWPGRRIWLLARRMADARTPGTLHVAWTPALVRRLTHSAHVRPAVVGRVRDRLIEAGFLTPTSRYGTFALTVPAGLGACR